MALEKYRGEKPSREELTIVVGAGRSGLAACALLRKNDVPTRLLDRNPKAIPPDVRAGLEARGVEICLGDHTPEQFSGASYVVASPGMPVSSLREFVPEGFGAPEIISEMELAWRYLDNEPVLAVTGTSGKTTTASLAAAMLKSQGYSVFLGGNIGTPLSEYVLDHRVADVLVLEISSFQLQGCSTFCPRVGVLLNISPNHLDYHKDMAEYIEAKFRIFRCQDEGDLALLGDIPRQLATEAHIPGRVVWIELQDRFPDLQLLGKHNALNAEAAWQAVRFFGVSLENARRAAASFSPLPHRLEKIRELDGVLYVNDSKCTTIAALKVALEAFARPVRLLCGGKFKGGNLEALAPLVRSRVVEVGLFGASREHFEQAWKDAAPMSWHPTLKEAVAQLRAGAKAGDVVLLAPATSSFDLYANYLERGDDFRKIVGALQ